MSLMSTNVIYQGSAYHVVNIEGHELELESVEDPELPHIRVDVMQSGLVIDPTDDQWAASRGQT
jgi:hypothetical protein